MSKFLEQLFNLSLHNPDAFRELLDSHREEITPELADEAHSQYREAFEAQQTEYTIAAAVTACNLYLRLGNRYEALKHSLYVLDFQYLSASTAEAYQIARVGAISRISNAEEITALDQAFKAATLAANCSYFTAELQDTPVTKEYWLRQTLVDLILACGYGPQAKRDDLEQFVSLLTGFMHRITTLIPLPDVSLDHQLRQLAQGVEQFVPMDFQFRTISGGNKSASSARWLAVLSRRFGNSDVAQRRLELAPRNDL